MDLARKDEFDTRAEAVTNVLATYCPMRNDECCGEVCAAFEDYVDGWGGGELNCKHYENVLARWGHKNWSASENEPHETEE